MKNENQDLRKRTKDFALRIIKLYASLPRFAVAQTLGNHLLRLGTRWELIIGKRAVLARTPNFVSKLGDSLKELEETSYRLELLGDSGTIGSQWLALLIDETSQLIAILTSIAKKIRSR